MWLDRTLWPHLDKNVVKYYLFIVFSSSMVDLRVLVLLMFFGSSNFRAIKFLGLSVFRWVLESSTLLHALQLDSSSLRVLRVFKLSSLWARCVLRIVFVSLVVFGSSGSWVIGSSCSSSSLSLQVILGSLSSSCPSSSPSSSSLQIHVSSPRTWKTWV